MYKKIFNNNSGFTLIEIIASIALLALVITLLLPMFPQILQWTNNTENELTASNLIGQVAYDLKKEEINFVEAVECGESLVGEKNPLSETYEINNTEYKGFYQLCEEKSVELYKTTLYQAKIMVYGEENDLISESYTYIKENKGDQP